MTAAAAQRPLSLRSMWLASEPKTEAMAMTTGVRGLLGARAPAWDQRELVEDEAGDQLLAQEGYGHGLAGNVARRLPCAPMGKEPSSGVVNPLPYTLTRPGTMKLWVHKVS